MKRISFDEPPFFFKGLETMMLYLRIDVTRVFGKVPSGKTGRFFASLASDAISSGRFEETHTEVIAINCCDERDANEEFRRRDDELYSKFPNSRVSIRAITANEYDSYAYKNEQFDDFMHRILNGKVVA
jgi:hypothetical protein